MVKLTKENLCCIPPPRLDLTLCMSVFILVVSNIASAGVCRLLVSYARQISSRIDSHQQLKMRRDLTVVHRVVFLNIQLILVDIPVAIFVIVDIIRPDILPHNCMRIFFMIVNLALGFMLLILCWITPNLRQSLAECFNLATRFQTGSDNRARPITNVKRF
ncbi:unnamed protein product [Rotaria socialis]|uniref:Uncharacterized protein n=1 Tax=Rotaria socialis TaxID=392032 RepID=A0A818L279_9BILA|nr:unnamed protein product [Rotaria socialis]CAF3569381.1 unnamed protein product [Rotaria socialis]CAF3569957.1 unnamed protein product [Rotaria socialis]CAF3621873.1 unnamed protein product [Rotaria socialis]CAF4308665.1 unnamed protein product [Rotaria socialis]